MASITPSPATSAVPSPTQASDDRLTDRTTWALYIYKACDKIVKHEEIPIKYRSEDEAKMKILLFLNFYESHDQYTYPDHCQSLSFPQVMRMREALVNDVLKALVGPKTVKVGQSGERTLMFHETEKKRKLVCTDATQNRRVCRKFQYDGSSGKSSAASDGDDSKCWRHGDNPDFYAAAMSVLQERCDYVYPWSYSGRNRDADLFADQVENGLIERWKDQERKRARRSEMERKSD